jgi:CBS domain-containing protein
MKVRDYMTANVNFLRDDARLLDAALLIRRTDNRHVPVVDAEMRVVGIISDRDVSRLAPSRLGHITPDEYNNIFEATPIAQAMTREPIVVTPDTPVSDAVGILYSKRIGALPVVGDDHKLAGILSVSDMLGLLNEMLTERAAGAGGSLA